MSPSSRSTISTTHIGVSSAIPMKLISALTLKDKLDATYVQSTNAT